MNFGIAAFLDELGIDRIKKGFCQGCGLYEDTFSGLGIETISREEVCVICPNRLCVFHSGAVYTSGPLAIKSVRNRFLGGGAGGSLSNALRDQVPENTLLPRLRRAIKKF